MSASASSSVTDAQLNIRGYPWKFMNSKSPVPDRAVNQNGQLEGDEVYIGRVRDGKCLYIGTAIPKRNVCIYLDKDFSMKSSSTYEILTVEYLHDVMFLDMETDNLEIDELLNRSDILPAGVNGKGEILYVARHIDGENTYYGWLDKSEKLAFIPKDPKLGQQVLDKDIGALTFFGVPPEGICPPASFD